MLAFPGYERYNNNMPCLLRKMRWTLCVYFGIGCVLCFLCSCTEKLIAPSRPLHEERFDILTEKLKEQKEDIRHLTKLVQDLKRKPPVREKANSPKPIPIVKLQKPTKPEEELVDPTNSDVIADSSHAHLHTYFQALNLMKQRKYDDAIRHLEGFLRSHPEHIYADRVQFSLLEAHFLNKEFGLAVLDATLLETRYPHSLRQADGYYKKALSHLELGYKKLAKETLEKLLLEFPKSRLVEAASLKLTEFNHQNS